MKSNKKTNEKKAPKKPRCEACGARVDWNNYCEGCYMCRPCCRYYGSI